MLAKADATALRLINESDFLSQGSRQSAATLGFTEVAPLGQKNQTPWVTTVAEIKKQFHVEGDS
jgi:hypothetical protein